MTAAGSYRVDSEVGRLRQVILHRPGLELKRLTPGNKDRLLFDDVLWVHRAQEEHDRVRRGAARARRHRAPVRRAAARHRRACPRPASYILDAIFDERVYGPMAIDALRNCFDAMDTDTLTDHLVGGHHEARGARPDPRAALGRLPRARAGRLRARAAAQPPLHPRHLGLDRRRRRRSTACARRPAMRETAHYEAVYRWHPLFAGAGVRDLVGRASENGRGHHRGRRHARARRRRGADRDERAHHRARGSSGWPGGCSPAARWTGSSRCGCRRPGR